MTDLSDSFILLEGEPRTTKIDSIACVRSGMYSICFKSNTKIYTYRSSKVIWLKDSKKIDPNSCKIYQDGIELKDVAELRHFTYKNKNFWRIKYRNGFEKEYVGRISVATSCLDDRKTKNIFEYLKCIATVNPLGKEDHENGILSDSYDNIEFINDKTVAASYLNSEKYQKPQYECGNLIYPFGCNASQKKAVIAAFENPISVIQGPPGTGKTQTILNIIANIVLNGKTVLVVSNNNSATANIKEKLENYGLGFIVASLGKRDNKEAFIHNQPALPQDLSLWESAPSDKQSIEQDIRSLLEELDLIFDLQNEKAKLDQEQQSVELEWKHFCADHTIDVSCHTFKRAESSLIIDLWVQCQAIVDMKDAESNNPLQKWMRWLKWTWLMLRCKYQYHLLHALDKSNLFPAIIELQTLYYQNKRAELSEKIKQLTGKLESYNAQSLIERLTNQSMILFKASLYEKYKQKDRYVFKDADELWKKSKQVKDEFPVILSTTFSARNCLSVDIPFDYVVMDEASQVSVETGALALTCAFNAVIVGDSLQLHNVVKTQDRLQLDAIIKQFDVSDGYDSSKNSFLQSVCSVIKGVPQTLLREHYRCHPRIINFCNQKFYGGHLLIMTEDHGEENVLLAFKTVKGNHATGQYNQREIDVVKQEVLPTLNKEGSIGIVTPYNRQVDEFRHQLPNIDTGTIHKYQGREKDTIVMSVVDNQITTFADEPNLLNVAVSRAKSRFCLVVTGNDQQHHGNVMDLLDYINYNNCTVTESKITSIFDYLYTQYTEQRSVFMHSHPSISDYVSENITYTLILDIIKADVRFNGFNVFCHFPLRQIIKDTSLLSPDELKYVSNSHTHVDFLIVSSISRKPILAIETDGYSFHNDSTEQHGRDVKKNHVLALYGLPLLRLSTKGCNEKESIENALNQQLFSY